MTVGPANPSALGITQVGLETTAGTPVAATRRIPSMASFKLDRKYIEPKEQRGTFDQSYDIIPLAYNIPWTVKHEYYYSTSLWMWMTSVTKNPVITTNPASPSSLLTSTQASGTLALTTQPADNDHGRLLFTVNNTSGSPTAAGTITVTGTPVGGAAGTSEVVTLPAIAAGATRKLCTNTCWSDVSNVASSVTTVGLMITIQGFTDFVWTFTPTNLPSGLSTVTFEEFDGTGTWQYPFGFTSGIDLDWAPEKAVDIQAKGFASVQNTLGGGLTALTLPTDQPFSGGKGAVFIDPIGGTPGTTQNTDLLTYKFSSNLGSKPVMTATGLGTYDRFVRGYLTSQLDLEIDFRDLTEYTYFKNDVNRIFQTVLTGPFYFSGVLSQTPKLTIITPCRYQTMDIDRTKENVTVKVKAKPYVEPSLGYSYQVVVNTLQPDTTGL